jgi:hypothetical protein
MQLGSTVCAADRAHLLGCRVARMNAQPTPYRSSLTHSRA